MSRLYQRHGLYLFSLAALILASLALYTLSVPAVFLRLIGAAVGIVVICMLVNFVWKISVHSASIATLATICAKVSLPLGVFFWLVALAVGWARIRTGNHTPLQVIAGWAVAVAGVVLALQ